MSDSLWPHGLQHARHPCPSPTPGVFSQTHVHWVSDAIQPSHPLLSPSSPALDLSQHQCLFQWVGSSHQVELQHQSLQRLQDWFLLGLIGLISLLSKRLARVFSSTTIGKYQFFSTHIHRWLLEKKHSFDYMYLWGIKWRFLFHRMKHVISKISLWRILSFILGWWIGRTWQGCPRPFSALSLSLDCLYSWKF